MPAGRPPIYTDPEELELKIEGFFIACEELEERPTVTGLTLHLGFADKSTLYDYRDKENPEFSHPIKKALTRIEHALEKRLENNSVAGIIFGLKNMGWKDKQETEHSGEMGITWHETRNYEPNQKTD